MSQTNFYDYIKKVSDNASDKKYYSLISDALYKAVMDNHKKIIINEAAKGKKEAVLFTYLKDARFKNKIPVHAHMDPSDDMLNSYKRAEVQPVLTRVRAALAPFEIELRETDQAQIFLLAKWQ